VPRVDDGYLESRRRQIMEAAVACFARHGFHGTTMQDIVAETGLSAGAIYRYFPAKEGIVAAIAAEHHSREAAVLADVEAGADLGPCCASLRVSRSDGSPNPTNSGRGGSPSSCGGRPCATTCAVPELAQSI